MGKDANAAIRKLNQATTSHSDYMSHNVYFATLVQLVWVINDTTTAGELNESAANIMQRTFLCSLRTCVVLDKLLLIVLLCGLAGFFVATSDPPIANISQKRS